MLRKVISQLAFVNGKGIGNMTLAFDATPSSTQAEMDLSSLLRLSIADLPTSPRLRADDSHRQNEPAIRLDWDVGMR